MANLPVFFQITLMAIAGILRALTQTTAQEALLYTSNSDGSPLINSVGSMTAKIHRATAL